MRKSKLFLAVLILFGLYFFARECAQLAAHAGWLDLGVSEDLTETWLAGDLRIHVNAARRLAAGEDLYYSGYPPKFEVYNYTPFYALLLSTLGGLTFEQHALLHALLVLAAYIGLFFTWRWMFPRLGLPQALPVITLSLPVWFLFTGWWGDALLLNLYVILALVTSWLFYSLWREKLWTSAFILILILQVKPQWAFALGLPLLLGRWRFFGKLALLTAAGYLGIAALTILILGPEYGGTQYLAYLEMLSTHHLEIPWHGPGEFIGYDHSIAQIYFYLFGYDPSAWGIVRLIKLLILLPLGVLFFHRLRQRQPGEPSPLFALEAFFLLYCASFIWLDLVWEATLSIVIFIYLMTVLPPQTRPWAAVPFVLYALADLWQVIGIPTAAAIYGQEVISTQGPPIWADPSFHLPLTMFVFLTFYVLMLRRLFEWNPRSAAPAIVTPA